VAGACVSREVAAVGVAVRVAAVTMVDAAAALAWWAGADVAAAAALARQEGPR
jgi:hypothetical protein